MTPPVHPSRLPRRTCSCSRGVRGVVGLESGGYSSKLCGEGTIRWIGAVTTTMRKVLFVFLLSALLLEVNGVGEFLVKCNMYDINRFDGMVRGRELIIFNSYSRPRGPGLQHVYNKIIATSPYSRARVECWRPTNTHNVKLYILGAL